MRYPSGAMIVTSRHGIQPALVAPLFSIPNPLGSTLQHVALLKALQVPPGFTRETVSAR